MPGKRAIEKSKDFKGSMIRLIKSMARWKIKMIIAIALGLISTLVILITPGQVSILTDTITYSMTVNQKEFEKLYNTLSESERDVLYNGVVISNQEKEDFLSLFEGINIKNENEIIKRLDSVPEKIKDIVIPKLNFNKIKKYALIIGILFLLNSLLSYIENYILISVSNNFAKHLRTKISKKINKLPLKYFDNHEAGDILSRVTNDVDAVSGQLSFSIATLIMNSSLLIGVCVIMFITNIIMAATAILSSLIGIVFMLIVVSKSQKYFVKRQKKLGDMNGFIEEAYSSHVVIKSYNGVDSAIKEFNDLNKELYICNKKASFLSGLMPPFMNFVGNLGYVCVCVVGVILASKNMISFGVIVAFIMYVRQFTNPLAQISQTISGLQSTAAASERVFEVLDEEEVSSEEECTSYLDKNKAKGNIEFKNVSFGYNDKEVIKDFSLKASTGDKIAIVGPTGAGKTTLVNLLMKFYDIKKGDILIDGISIKELTRENISDLFTMVLQDTWLFDGSIKENLIFNNENISDKRLYDVLSSVELDHFVNTLSNGINENISENDAVSSGQKQLLTIARGMIKSSPFLILDEATSNVDTRTEKIVASAMDKLSKGKTSFIIAHRLSTIKNANIILVINEGNIIEKGTHDELMKKKGFYADLYNSQFKL